MLRPWTASEGGGRMILFGHALLEHLYFKRGQVMTGAIILRDESFIQTAEIDPRRIDSLLEKRLKNAAEFLEPKADQTVKLDSAGAGWFL